MSQLLRVFAVLPENLSRLKTPCVVLPGIVTPVPEDPMASSRLCAHLCVHTHRHTDLHSCKLK